MIGIYELSPETSLPRPQYRGINMTLLTWTCIGPPRMRKRGEARRRDVRPTRHDREAEGSGADVQEGVVRQECRGRRR